MQSCGWIGIAVEVWGVEQHLGGAGGWDVEEGPGLSQTDEERAQAGAEGILEGTGVEGRWGLKLRARSEVLQKVEEM